MSNSDQDIVPLLQQSVEGLLYMSESEAPFEAFLWDAQPPITPEMVLQQTHHPSDSPIEPVSLDQFFEVATEEQDWYGPEEQEQAKKYQHLVGVLKSKLSDVQVYRIGKTKIDVYILGKVESGHIAGIYTQVVET